MSEPLQLDLFVEEGETLASLIVLDLVCSILDAGGNLGTMKIQTAINASRERSITMLTRVLLNSQKRESRRDRPASQATAQTRRKSYERE